jgi:hypothetical protein
MTKYISDFIRNQSRSVLNGLTRPQQKAITEVIRGLFTAGEPILRRLAQDPNKGVKRQGDKYGYHLSRVDLTETVEDLAIRRAKQSMKRDTIIAYDLSDISKECAEKMEGMSGVFDGSKRKPSQGYVIHGIGVNTSLLSFRVHHSNTETLNQPRKELVEKISTSFGQKGIWVFDRGNDDKAFFLFLRQELNRQFIARLKSNRLVVVSKTGVLHKVKDLPTGQYEVYLMNTTNTKVNTRLTFTLTISKHLENKQPMRLLSYTKKNFSAQQLVQMYLERWGIENIFKRAKQLFQLEKIRVLNYQRLTNLIALMHFVLHLCAQLYQQIKDTTFSLLSGAVLYYRKFIKNRALSFNQDSFIRFLQSSIKPYSFTNPDSPPFQPSLFTSSSLKKLVPF